MFHRDLFCLHCSSFLLVVCIADSYHHNLSSTKPSISSPSSTRLATQPQRVRQLCSSRSRPTLPRPLLLIRPATTAPRPHLPARSLSSTSPRTFPPRTSCAQSWATSGRARLAPSSRALLQRTMPSRDSKLALTRSSVRWSAQPKALPVCN